MQKSVIIVAGGSGRRMQSDIPKQFIEISGKPIIILTIEKFYAYDNDINIILVLPSKHIPHWNTLAVKYNLMIPFLIAKGGDTRFQSVKNGLALVEKGIVAIHDAVRPMVAVKTIQRCFETALQLGNAIPVIPVNDSLRVVENESNKPFDRNFVRIVQTPQCFNVNLIKNAYLQDDDIRFTDDATVFEKYGEKINLVEGNPENIKITHPVDIAFAEALLKL
ncbi:MAG: 2-C-methyl-D-erythritol 4-phosphate cytidylyltransferase [Bacteroidetes bacterium]|nr:2-C-methyl-D-erythritol 4-phosphate cytidylyltransferase [Bacteroidota bacterium]